MRVQRRLAGLVCGMLNASLPAANRDWARATRAEVAAIDNDAEALAFALETFWGLGVPGLGCRLLGVAVKIGGDDGLGQGLPRLGWRDRLRYWPRALGVASAFGAGLLGLAYLAAAGAPGLYIVGNIAALGLGLVMLAVVGRSLSSTPAGLGSVLLGLSLVLLGTAAFGEGASGATRWLRMGGLAVQPSLIVLPAMVVGFARSRTIPAVLAMILAAGALALQPDRATAGALCAGLAAQWLLRPDRRSLIAFAASAVGWSIALMRADALPPTPFVDGVLASALDVHALLGLAVLGAMALLLTPGLLGSLHGADAQEAYFAFAAVWGALFLAGAAGPYPTPIVGYGGSAIIGYLLSLALLPSRVPEVWEGRSALHGDSRAPPDPSLRLPIAQP